MSGVKTPAPRLAWVEAGAARARAPSVWRTRSAASLRVMLPAIGVGIVLTALAWPGPGVDDRRVRLGGPRLTAADAEQPTMFDARFAGVDESGRPFLVTADQAAQDDGASDRLHLTGPKADMTQASGAWVQASAERGVFRRAEQLLDLAGGVTLYQDDGTEIVTEAAHVRPRDGYAEGSAPVSGHGPTVVLRSNDGFRLRERGKVVELLGRAQVIVRGAPGPEAAQ